MVTPPPKKKTDILLSVILLLDKNLAKSNQDEYLWKEQLAFLSQMTHSDHRKWISL